MIESCYLHILKSEGRRSQWSEIMQLRKKCPPVIKHHKGESLASGSFDGKIIYMYTCRIHCHVWLPKDESEAWRNPNVYAFFVWHWSPSISFPVLVLSPPKSPTVYGDSRGLKGPRLKPSIQMFPSHWICKVSSYPIASYCCKPLYIYIYILSCNATA